MKISDANKFLKKFHLKEEQEPHVLECMNHTSSFYWNTGAYAWQW